MGLIGNCPVVDFRFHPFLPLPKKIIKGDLFIFNIEFKLHIMIVGHPPQPYIIVSTFLVSGVKEASCLL